MQSWYFVNVQLESQIISILPTAQGVTNVKSNSFIQGFYEEDIRQAEFSPWDNTLTLHSTSSFPAVAAWGNQAELEQI